MLVILHGWEFGKQDTGVYIAPHQLCSPLLTSYLGVSTAFSLLPRGSSPSWAQFQLSYQYQPVAIPFATGICVGVLMGVTCSI